MKLLLHPIVLASHYASSSLSSVISLTAFDHQGCQSDELLPWQAIGTASGRPEDAAAAALEIVSYAQMLVLFAPQAVPATAHLPLLLDTLPSRQPNLRRQAYSP